MAYHRIELGTTIAGPKTIEEPLDHQEVALLQESFPAVLNAMYEATLQRIVDIAGNYFLITADARVSHEEFLAQYDLSPKVKTVEPPQTDCESTSQVGLEPVYEELLVERLGITDAGELEAQKRLVGFVAGKIFLEPIYKEVIVERAGFDGPELEIQKRLVGYTERKK